MEHPTLVGHISAGVSDSEIVLSPREFYLKSKSRTEIQWEVHPNKVTAAPVRKLNLIAPVYIAC